MQTNCGIYIIKNKINDLVYVGQSVNIKIRWYAHIQSARNSKRRDHYTKIHQAMHDLGEENFYYEVLEICPVEKLNEREIFWIKEYDSYNNGYNMTIGGDNSYGENNGRAILTEGQVTEIRLMYNEKIPFREAYKRFENIISKRGFQKVWRFETWRHILPEVYTDENRLWHSTMAKASINGNIELGKNNTARKCSEEEIEKMRTLRAKGFSYQKISDETGRSIGVIRKYCLYQESKKPQADSTQPNAIRVQNIETGLIFDTIAFAAKWSHGDSKRISEIIRGKISQQSSSGTVPSTGEKAHWKFA